MTNARLESSKSFASGEWLHVTLAFDSTQDTSSDRVRMYVNGEQVVDFVDNRQPAQNLEGNINNSHYHSIGRYMGNHGGGDQYLFDGEMADSYFIDGQALDATAFGSDDEGSWSAEDYAGDLGTNGFHLDYADADLGKDAGGNGNDFSGHGSLSQGGTGPVIANSDRGTLIGGAGDDTLIGGNADDVIDGGTGIDEVRYAGNSSDFTVTDNGDGTCTVKGVGVGSDLISGVEKVVFDDKTIDLTGNNSGPVATDARAVLADFVGPVTYKLSFEDSDFLIGSDEPDFVAVDTFETLEFSVVGATESNGTYTLASGATVTIDNQGNYTYTPAQDQTESDSFTWRVTDRAGFSSEATVAISLSDETSNVGLDGHDYLEAGGVVNGSTNLAAADLEFGGSSEYLKQTFAEEGDRRTWTYSGWVKRDSFGNEQGTIFSSGGTFNSSLNVARIYFDSNNKLVLRDMDGSNSGSITTTTNVVSSEAFTDSEWYHVVVSYDTTQADPADSIKMYVNGKEITTFSTDIRPSQNYQGHINDNQHHALGRYMGNHGGSDFYMFDGQLADTHFVDGQALSHSDFGQVIDGQWVPKEYGGSHGANGFHVNFADDASIGTDSSGNGNNFETVGTVSQVADSGLSIPTLSGVSLSGGAGDDMLVGGANDDHLDGGSGEDVAAYEGSRSAYLIIDNGDGTYSVSARDGSSGTDLVSNVETLAFGNSETVDLTTGDVRPQAIDSRIVLPSGDNSTNVEQKLSAAEGNYFDPNDAATNDLPKLTYSLQGADDNGLLSVAGGTIQLLDASGQPAASNHDGSYKFTPDGTLAETQDVTFEIIDEAGFSSIGKVTIGLAEIPSYATLDASEAYDSSVLTNGNLTSDRPAAQPSNHYTYTSTLELPTDRISYFEASVDYLDSGADGATIYLGIVPADYDYTNMLSRQSDGVIGWRDNEWAIGMAKRGIHNSVYGYNNNGATDQITLDTDGGYEIGDTIGLIYDPEGGTTAGTGVIKWVFEGEVQGVVYDNIPAGSYKFGTTVADYKASFNFGQSAFDYQGPEAVGLYENVSSDLVTGSDGNDYILGDSRVTSIAGGAGDDYLEAGNPVDGPRSVISSQSVAKLSQSFGVSAGSLTEDGLRIRSTDSSTVWYRSDKTVADSSKSYFEMEVLNNAGTVYFGLVSGTSGAQESGRLVWISDGRVSYTEPGQSSEDQPLDASLAYAVGDKVGMGYDPVSGKVELYRNGELVHSYTDKTLLTDGLYAGYGTYGTNSEIRANFGEEGFWNDPQDHYHAIGSKLTGGDVGVTLNGGVGDDTLVGGVGADLIDGGAGTDVLKLAGDREDYQISDNGDGTITVTSDAGGADRISNVEKLDFQTGADMEITGANNGPVATSSLLALPDDGTGAMHKLTATDVDSDDVLTYRFDGSETGSVDVAGGRIELIRWNEATSSYDLVAENNDGLYRFVADGSVTSDADKVAFQVTDSSGFRSQAEVAVHIGGAPFEINGSASFNGSGDYLTQAAGSAGNQKTWTFSAWIKRDDLGRNQGLFGGGSSGNGNRTLVGLGYNNSNELRVYGQNGMEFTASKVDGNTTLDQMGEWYHVVVAMDTTQAAQLDRVKIFVDGKQVTGTDFSRSTYPAQNSNHGIGSGLAQYVGRWADYNGDTFEGSMSQVTYVDGQALDASHFGQKNSDGNWSAVAPDVADYGTKGFHLDFSNGSAIGKDASGTSSDLAVNGGVAQVSDIPNTGASLHHGIDTGTDGNDVLVGDATTNSLSGGAGDDYLEAGDVTQYAVLDTGNAGSGAEISSDGLTKTHTGGGNIYQTVASSLHLPTTGKAYFEVVTTGAESGSTSSTLRLGIMAADNDVTGRVGNGSEHLVGYYADEWSVNLHTTNDGSLAYPKNNNVTGAAVGSFTGYQDGQPVGILYDADTGTLSLYYGNQLQGVIHSGIPAGDYVFAASTGNYEASFNFGQAPFGHSITGTDGLLHLPEDSSVTLDGGVGDDTLIGGVGSDVIDGGDGTDVLKLAGDRSDYQISDNGDGTFTVTSEAGGTDTISNVEKLDFETGTDIEITSTNSGPVATSSLLSLPDNSTDIMHRLTATDANSDDVLTYRFDGSLTGSVEVTGGRLELIQWNEATSSYDLVAENNDGLYRFVADGSTTSETDKVDFRVTDSQGFASVASVALNIGPEKTSSPFQNAAQFDQSTGVLTRDWVASGTTWTLSTWVKLPVNGSSLNQTLLSSGYPSDWEVINYGGSGSNRPDEIYLLSSDHGGYSQSGTQLQDDSVWTHVVVQSDGGTPSLYLNGAEQTLSGSTTFQDINNVAQTHYIGNDGSLSAYFGGSMADYTFVDGQALSPEAFGGLDEAAGKWLPQEQSIADYGTNGFRLDFSDAGNLGKDVSGNGNDWTATGGIAQTSDTPLHNVALLDVDALPSGFSLNNGNKTLVQSGSQDQNMMAGTLSVSSGKWYFEATLDSAYNASSALIGIAGGDWNHSASSSTPTHLGANAAAWDGRGFMYDHDDSDTGYGTGIAVGDRVMVAFDADTGQVWFGKNGVWNNGEDPAAGTGAARTLTTGESYRFILGGSQSGQWTIHPAADEQSHAAPTGFGDWAETVSKDYMLPEGTDGNDVLVQENHYAKYLGTAPHQSDDTTITGGAGDDLLISGNLGRFPGVSYDTFDSDAVLHFSKTTLLGGAGDDTLVGAAGSDVIDGGDGTDIFELSSNAASYLVEQTGENSFNVTFGDVTDQVSNVETLRFGDGTELDLTTENNGPTAVDSKIVLPSGATDAVIQKLSFDDADLASADGNEVLAVTILGASDGGLDVTGGRVQLIAWDETSQSYENVSSNADGLYRFTPDGSATAEGSFEYQVTDSKGFGARGKVDVMAGLAAGHKIDHSIDLHGNTGRFNWTAGAGADRSKWTLSGWVKRGSSGSSQMLYSLDRGNHANNSDMFYVGFEPTGQFRVYEIQNASPSNLVMNLVTEDAWDENDGWINYHIELDMNPDSGQTEDRVRIWMNGAEIDQFVSGQELYPSSSTTLAVGMNSTMTIGREDTRNRYPLDAELAEMRYLDGVAHGGPQAAGLGHFEDGVWVPDAYEGDYGANGYLLDFADSGNYANNASGESSGSTITLSGSVAAGTDTPTTGMDLLENIYVGTDGNDILVGDAAATSISGGAGDDYLEAGDVTQYAVLDTGNAGSGAEISSDGLTKTHTGGGNIYQTVASNLHLPTTGKAYFEVVTTGAESGSTSSTLRLGIMAADNDVTGRVGVGSEHLVGYYADEWSVNLHTTNDGSLAYPKNNNVTGAAVGSFNGYQDGQPVGILYDADAGTLSLYYGNQLQGVIHSGIPAGDYVFAASTGNYEASFNFGQNSSVILSLVQAVCCICRKTAA